MDFNFSEEQNILRSCATAAITDYHSQLMAAY